MRGDDRIIEFLNEHLTAELTLINQYFLGSRIFDNWGLRGLAKILRDISLEEMEDAEHLIDRILYLEGHPNLQRLGTVRVGETPQEQLELALDCERAAIERLRRGVELCVEVGDHGTRELVARMLEEEERHTDFFESQLDVIQRVGVQNYLAQYVRGD
ncbi:MAG TPA: bacterioferritin [Nitriliruptorales bacterium]|nr:bacterioferritin [Nitriliruptorales bacterium]